MSSWKNIRSIVLKRDNYRCVLFGKENSGQVHHIIPRSKGGTEELSNLITLCGRCHMLLSPVPDWVISKVWEIPLERANLERLKVSAMIKRFEINKS
jgi:hypothetical protein